MLTFTPRVTPFTMSISGCNIPFSQSVRNLGFYIDETLSMDEHIKYLCRILFFQLRTIVKIRSFLFIDAANKLAVSLIPSRLDYCNSLLSGITENKLNKLQRIQNHAARLVLHKSRQCIYQNSMPPYISDLFHPYCPTRTLHSLDTSLLTVPRFSLETFGKRFFSVFGPTVWNSLPLSLKKKCVGGGGGGGGGGGEEEKKQRFTTFKKKRKTYLFEFSCAEEHVNFCMYHSGGVRV